MVTFRSIPVQHQGINGLLLLVGTGGETFTGWIIGKRVEINKRRPTNKKHLISINFIKIKKPTQQHNKKHLAVLTSGGAATPLLIRKDKTIGSRVRVGVFTGNVLQKNVIYFCLRRTTLCSNFWRMMTMLCWICFVFVMMYGEILNEVM